MKWNTKKWKWNKFAFLGVERYEAWGEAWGRLKSRTKRNMEYNIHSNNYWNINIYYRHWQIITINFEQTGCESSILALFEKGRFHL